MTPLQMMEARLVELRQQITSLFEQRGALIDLAAAEKRGLSDSEKASYDDLTARKATAEKEAAPVEARVAELREQEQRAAAAAAATAPAGGGEQRSGGAKVTDAPVYHRDNVERSFFRDLAKASLFGDADATDRLRRNNAQQAESRALGNTGAAGGSGGEFSPPAWLIDEWVALPRAGRVTANLFNHMVIPDGVSSINLPKVLTGTTVAIQSTQNTALSQTDLTTGTVQTGLATIGGKQIVSQQLLDTSQIAFDQVLFGDLNNAYNQQVGAQALTGTGTGSGTGATINGLGNATVAAGNAITWTQASPTVAGFYGRAAAALAAFETSRFLPPTAWVMHPRRWYWLVSAVDSNGRPLVVPQGQAFNTMATMDNVPAQGPAGMFFGLPVYIDPNVPTNLGVGTNQDIVYLLRQEDLWLFETAPKFDVLRETYGDSLGVLFRLYGYVATVLNRLTASIGTIGGTGLVTPTFAS